MPTVSALKELFLAKIAPQNDKEFLRLLVEADMRLLEYGRWRWTKTRTTLTPVDGYVVLPADYSSVLGARIDKFAVDIRDEDYEFVPGGRGEVDLGIGSSRLIDQGLNDDELRHYKVTGHIDPDDVVTALVHFAPKALYDDFDTTRCPDATALKLMMFGIIFEEANDLGQARSYIADALRSLDNKEQSQRGNAARTVNFRPSGPGVRGIRNVR